MTHCLHGVGHRIDAERRLAGDAGHCPPRSVATMRCPAGSSRWNRGVSARAPGVRDRRNRSGNERPAGGLSSRFRCRHRDPGRVGFPPPTTRTRRTVLGSIGRECNEAEVELAALWREIQADSVDDEEARRTLSDLARRVTRSTDRCRQRTHTDQRTAERPVRRGGVQVLSPTAMPQGESQRPEGARPDPDPSERVRMVLAGDNRWEGSGFSAAPRSGHASATTAETAQAAGQPLSSSTLGSPGRRPCTASRFRSCGSPRRGSSSPAAAWRP